MSNSWFQFKQFYIAQDRCGMKVTTDACIQGAWTPLLPGVKRILDIGTGTGLLALMLAQRTRGSAEIDAVEIDAAAASQAKENAGCSPWADKIRVIHGDICELPLTVPYDLIICNPPFFRNSLQAPEHRRNAARHDGSLSLESLREVIRRRIAPGGTASVLLPADIFPVWKGLHTEANGYFSHELHVQPFRDKPLKRIVGMYHDRLPAAETQVTHLSVREHSQILTPEFTALLSGFYL